MKRQNYKNYRKFYYPHHFIFYPVVLLLTGLSVNRAFEVTDRKWEWAAITAILILITWLAFMMRQHYALNNQDRIVRLEMRLRYYQLTHKPFEALEMQLSFSQIAALRFAPDAELPGLINQALTQNLSADEIKKYIKNWLPDNMRV